MSVVAIGNFDGLHLGHQALLKKAVLIASEAQLPSIAYTFTPHPRKAPRLMSDAQKAARITELGITQAFFQKFDTSFASLTSLEFIEQVLIGQLQALHVVIGPNFAFGAGARGDADTLRSESRLTTHVVPPVCIDSEVCSSSLIRAAVVAGDLAKATRLLGREYCLTGEVIKGDGRGHQLGFPTANMKVQQEILPPFGVYETFSPRYGKGATNIGIRPTFKDHSSAQIETYFPDFSGDLYGKEIEIILKRKIRDEMRFASVSDLTQQIRRDLEIIDQA
ncbi:MAG: riboflavin biosynthesis protein RibF [Myxococcota bacterium]